MASAQLKYKGNLIPVAPVLGVLMLCAVSACNKPKRIYQSNCNGTNDCRHISFRQLIDSMENFDHQYIEVDGKYEEGKGMSALVNDSLFADHSSQHAIWVNFSQDCPLYLKGTHQGLFEYTDGEFNSLNNHSITIRGVIDVRHKGHLGSYRGSIDRVSFVKL